MMVSHEAKPLTAHQQTFADRLLETPHALISGEVGSGVRGGIAAALGTLPPTEIILIVTQLSMFSAWSIHLHNHASMSVASQRYRLTTAQQILQDCDRLRGINTLIIDQPIMGPKTRAALGQVILQCHRVWFWPRATRSSIWKTANPTNCFLGEFKPVYADAK